MSFEESPFQRHFSQESGATGDTLQQSQSQSQSQSRDIPGAGTAANHQKKLDLLEGRFHEPPKHLIKQNQLGNSVRNSIRNTAGTFNGTSNSYSVGATNDFLPPMAYIHQHQDANSETQHSFGFEGTSNSKISGTPSKNNIQSQSHAISIDPLGITISGTSPSTQILESVADQHLQRVSRSLSSAMPQDHMNGNGSTSALNHFSNADASIGTFATDTISRGAHANSHRHTHTHTPGHSDKSHTNSTTAAGMASPSTSRFSTCSNARSHSMSSNQTLITAHTTKRHDIIVAESPPVCSNGHHDAEMTLKRKRKLIQNANMDVNSSTNTNANANNTNTNANDKKGFQHMQRPANSNGNQKPGSYAKNGATPRVARAILGEKEKEKSATPNSQQKRKTSTPNKITIMDKKRQKARDSTTTSPAATKKVTSNQGTEQDGVSAGPNTPLLDESSNVSPSPTSLGSAKGSGVGVGSGSGTKEKIVVAAVVSSSSSGNAVAAGTQPITNFFMNQNKPKVKENVKRGNNKVSGSTSALSVKVEENAASSNLQHGKNTISSSQPQRINKASILNDTASVQEVERLGEIIAQLTEALNEKTSQLKAVSNNQTIIHSQLKKALHQREEEMESLKEEMKRKNEMVRDALEELIRKDSMREQDDLRHKLASDGARLGRWVYNWVGMRRETLWEDGSAIKICEAKRKEIKAKRDRLVQRLNKESKGMESIDNLEREEFAQSIRIQLGELNMQEMELKRKEDSLYLEKNAHKLALKQVANEDYSQFKARPKLNGRYVLMSQLGKGGFSEVWRAFDLDDVREVAVKIHQLDTRWSEAKIENYTKHVAREYEIHRDVRHPRIVSLYDVFEIDDNSFATVLECCKGTDLDTLLKERKRLPELHARAILLQILSGMRYLSTPSKSDNRAGIIHYDLKPGNILFDEFGDAKITDFGLSKIMDSPDPSDSMELTSQGAGTYWYLPPECFITTESVRITNKVDVWSIGVIFYQMLYGRRPFGDGQSQEGVLANNVMLNAREVPFPDSPKISDAAKAFLCQCLMYEQALRPNIAELCKIPYVSGNIGTSIKK